MTKLWKKWLARALVFALLLSLLPGGLTARAAEGDTPETTETTAATETTETTVATEATQASIQETQSGSAASAAAVVSVVFYTQEATLYETVTVTAGGALGADMPEEPAQEGYTFLGWYIGGDYQAANLVTESTTFDADTTVQACWEETAAAETEATEAAVGLTSSAGEEETVTAESVQDLIDALPTLDTAYAMSTQELQALNDRMSAIWDLYYDELDAQEQALVDTAALEALSDYINGMTMTLETTSVAKIGDIGYTTLQEAIDAAGTSAATVTLLTDTKEDITIASGQNITLVLNGKTLTNSVGHTITNNGTLTITGSGTVDNVTHGKAAVYNNGTITLNGGTYTRSEEAGSTPSDNGGNSWYVIYNAASGSMTINDGTAVTSEGNYSSLVDNNNILTINGGSFTNGMHVIKNEETGTLAISGGSFTATYTGSNAVAALLNWGQATLSGGTFASNGGVAVANYEWDRDSSLTVTGGTFSGGNYGIYVVSYASGEANDANNITVSISNASVTGTNGSLVVNDDDTSSQTLSVTITSGTFTGALSASSTDSKIVISGGTYTTDVSEYVIAGNKAIDNGTGTYSIGVDEDEAIAEVNGMGYMSLQEAIDAAGDGDTVTLLKDVVLSDKVTINSGSVTLDLAGCSITRSADNTTSYLIDVGANASLIVQDSGTGGNIASSNFTIGGTTYVGYGIRTSGSVTIESGTVSGYYGIWQNNGLLTVSGGTVTGTSVGVVQRGGSLSITGGTVGGDSCARAIETVASNSDAAVNITGGTVSATNLAVYIADSTYAATLTIGEQGGGTAPSVTGTGYAAVYATTGADVIVNSGTVSGSTGIILWGGESDENPSTLTINGGTITGTNGFGVSTNGSTHYTSITMNDGSVSGVYGMYLPAMDSTTTINGGTVTGSSSGIEIRAGELNVTGGTIASTSATGEFSTNGSGTTTVGAGIAVSQHSTNQELTVNINGGTISGYYGVSEINTYTNNTEDVTINISGTASVSTNAGSAGGADVYSHALDSTSNYKNDHTTVSISGGTFSQAVPEAYCASGYSPTPLLNGTYTVCDHSSTTYVAAKAATCTEAGNAEYSSCNDCGMYLINGVWTDDNSSVIIPATGHSYSTTWSSDADSHWHACTVCNDKTDTASHTFTLVNGVYTCSVCGYVKANDTAKTPAMTVSAGSGSSVYSGKQLKYTISYYNNLNETATVTIVDQLDSGVTFVRASDGGVYDSSTHTVTWTLSAAALTQDSVTVTVKVNDSALTADSGESTPTIYNSAKVTVGSQAAASTNTVSNPVKATSGLASTGDSFPLIVLSVVAAAALAALLVLAFLGIRSRKYKGKHE